MEALRRNSKGGVSTGAVNTAAARAATTRAGPSEGNRWADGVGDFNSKRQSVVDELKKLFHRP